VICLGPSNVTTFLVDTELSNVDFSFEWQLNGGLISGATQSSFLAFEPGIYSITYTDRITMCSNTIDVEVKGVSDPESLDLEVSNGSFANSQNIIANVVGDGEYEYSIDNSSFQESNIFNNVSLGLREISARDINGCGSITEEIFVFGFPSFFTPNNDGRNDTWNVVADDNLPEITIFIFDRYGKLLFQIDPGIGIDWDGTFNGIPMPATDYWFVARLADGSETYRGHFTLKR